MTGNAVFEMELIWNEEIQELVEEEKETSK